MDSAAPTGLRRGREGARGGLRIDFPGLRGDAIPIEWGKIIVAGGGRAREFLHQFRGEVVVTGEKIIGGKRDEVSGGEVADQDITVRGHGLEEYQGEPFVTGRENEQAGVGVEVVEGFTVECAGEDDRKATGLVLQRSGVGVFVVDAAGDSQNGVWQVDLPEGFNEEIKALFGSQAPHGEEKATGFEAQPGEDIGGGQGRGGFHPIGNIAGFGLNKGGIFSHLELIDENDGGGAPEGDGFTGAQEEPADGSPFGVLVVRAVEGEHDGNAEKPEDGGEASRTDIVDMDEIGAEEEGCPGGEKGMEGGFEAFDPSGGEIDEANSGKRDRGGDHVRAATEDNQPTMGRKTGIEMFAVLFDAPLDTGETTGAEHADFHGREGVSSSRCVGRGGYGVCF